MIFLPFQQPKYLILLIKGQRPCRSCKTDFVTMVVSQLKPLMDRHPWMAFIKSRATCCTNLSFSKNGRQFTIQFAWCDVHLVSRGSDLTVVLYSDDEGSGASCIDYGSGSGSLYIIGTVPGELCWMSKDD